MIKVYAKTRQERGLLLISMQIKELCGFELLASASLWIELFSKTVRSCSLRPPLTKWLPFTDIEVWCFTEGGSLVMCHNRIA